MSNEKEVIIVSAEDFKNGNYPKGVPISVVMSTTLSGTSKTKG